MKKIAGGITAPRGFKGGALHCGIKKKKKDLALIYSEIPAVAVGFFTTNKVKAAPLIIDIKQLRKDVAQAIIINSGNANACTGEKGIKDALRMIEITAEGLSIPPKYVLVASTGLIGVPLPIKKIEKGIKEIVKKLNGEGVAQAIMTTDTFPKEIAVEFKIKGKKVRVGGIAKGSGMIAPCLATLLSFFTTDAVIGKRTLKKALKNSLDKSFNMITVDGDMSTNDTVLFLANGKAENIEIEERSKEYEIFQEALDFVVFSLAKMIVQDGEGATKFVEINVQKALTFKEAKAIAFSIANSNLVKTALFGENSNWGRIMSAVGQVGKKIKEEKIDIYLGKRKWVSQGHQEKLKEKEVKDILKNSEIKLLIDLNIGEKEATVWTCDLSPDYVKINASYRT